MVPGNFKIEAVRADTNAMIDEMVEVRGRHAVGELGLGLY